MQLDNTKKINIFMMLAVLVIGCNIKKQENRDVPEPQKTVTISESQSGQSPIIPVVAGERANGWFSIQKNGHEYERCYGENGCKEDDIKVLQGVVKSAEGIFCGDNKDNVLFVSGYRCDVKTGRAKCSQNECLCGNIEIKRDELCEGTVVDEKFAAGSSPYLVNSLNNNAVTNAGEMPNSVTVPEKKTAVVRTCGDERIVIDDGNYAEFDCLEVHYSGTGGFNAGFWYCRKPEGCKTRDGRIYAPLSLIHDNTEMIEENRDFCEYYLYGTEDTTPETTCQTGDCVFPKDANLNKRLVRLSAYTEWIPPDFTWECEDKNEKGECEITELTEESGIPVEGFITDTAACEGGTRYCHGKNNKPMKVPEAAAGYLCKPQYQLPGTERVELDDNSLRAWECTENECVCGGLRCPQNAVCIDEVCYCNDKKVDPNANYGCEIRNYFDHKAWEFQFVVKNRCLGGQCPCGNSFCSTNMECINNQCVCGLKEKPSESNWICSDIEIFTDEDNHWRCHDTKGCACGSNTCPMNAMCVDGECTCTYQDVQPGAEYVCEYSKGRYLWKCAANGTCPCYGETVNKDNYCYAPHCSNEAKLSADGCLCGGKPVLDDQKSSCLKSIKYGDVNVAQDDNYNCGLQECEEGMYCFNGKCIIPEISDGEAAHRYWIGKIAVDAELSKECQDDDGCFCGSEKCPKSFYCLNGTSCVPAKYSFSRGGHCFSYSLPDYADEEYSIDEMMSGIWQYCGVMYDVLTKELLMATELNIEEKYPIDYEKSDDIGDYACVISSTETSDSADWFEQSFIEKYVPDGLECYKDYCMCGKSRCSTDEECRCSYHEEEHRVTCSCSDLNAVTVYNSELVGCGDSQILAKQEDGYTCDSELGFVCTQKDKCACGNAVCKRGMVCLSSGVCTPVVKTETAQ